MALCLLVFQNAIQEVSVDLQAIDFETIHSLVKKQQARM